jgi:hypothetical protein
MKTDGWVSDTICVGLELEFENVSVQTTALTANNLFPDGHLLEFKRDGSLRPRDESTEIVFSGPLSGAGINKALQQIHKLVEALPFTISWRCGMHVHIDCRDISWQAAYRAFVLSAMIEPLLYAWDGTGRRENKFCQSIVDSIGSFTGENQVIPNVHFTKYSVVNAHSLSVLGSLELRFAASTASLRRMRQYINLGMALRVCGESFPSSERMIESMLESPHMAQWLSENIPGEAGPRLSALAVDLNFNRPSNAALIAGLRLKSVERLFTNDPVGGRHKVRRPLRPELANGEEPLIPRRPDDMMWMDEAVVVPEPNFDMNRVLEEHFEAEMARALNAIR